MFLRKLLPIVALTVASALAAAPSLAQTSTTAPAATQGKKATRAQNRQLENQVRHTLTKTKDLDASGIIVVARSGKVTLDGTVPDEDQIQLAGDTAAGVTGVSNVTNNVRMREAGH
jgi:hyperosmotically inducible periplasmic protein